MKVATRGDKLLAVLKQMPGEAIHSRDVGVLAGFDMQDPEEVKRVESAIAYLARTEGLGVSRVRRGHYVYRASPEGRQALENDMAPPKQPNVPDFLAGVTTEQVEAIRAAAQVNAQANGHVKPASSETPEWPSWLPPRDKIHVEVTTSKNGKTMVQKLSDPTIYSWLNPV